jgi:sulfur relay (sulfurtransferase) DsrC/TusE family protein
MNLEKEIKKEINYYLKNVENWDALCASLHIIKDLQRPKEEYQLLTTINHLESIGIIQTVYIEQDSIETLKYAINQQQKEKYFTLTNYKKIRDLRNQVFGHPSEKKAGKRKTRHFFDIENNQSQLIKHLFWGTEKEIESENFFISDLIEQNSKITIDYLKEFKNEIKLKFESIMNNYKIKFNLLFKGASYTFEKLLTKENDEITISTYGSIDEDISKVREGLIERNMLENFQLKIEVLEFLSEKLKGLFGKQTYKDVEFYTYASTLRNNIRILQKELKEVDSIFE